MNAGTCPITAEHINEQVRNNRRVMEALARLLDATPDVTVVPIMDDDGRLIGHTAHAPGLAVEDAGEPRCPQCGYVFLHARWPIPDGAEVPTTGDPRLWLEWCQLTALEATRLRRKNYLQISARMAALARDFWKAA